MITYLGNICMTIGSLFVVFLSIAALSGKIGKEYVGLNIQFKPKTQGNHTNINIYVAK